MEEDIKKNIQIQNVKDWKKTWWGIIILIGLSPFIGLYWIWTKSNWDKSFKIIASIPLILIIIPSIIISGLISSKFNNRNETSSSVKSLSDIIENISLTPKPTSIPNQTITSSVLPSINPLPTVYLSPTSTPKLTPTISINLEKSDITVQSKIVKEINNKYRYFFDIRNHGFASFKGKISISLYNKEGSFITETAFSTDELTGTAFNQQIPPELGMSRYVEAHSGPVKIHGEFGISDYKYEVIENGKTIKKDSGTITSEFESIDY